MHSDMLHALTCFLTDCRAFCLKYIPGKKWQLIRFTLYSSIWSDISSDMSDMYCKITADLKSSLPWPQNLETKSLKSSQYIYLSLQMETSKPDSLFPVIWFIDDDVPHCSSMWWCPVPMWDSWFWLWFSLPEETMMNPNFNQQRPREWLAFRFGRKNLSRRCAEK